MAHEVETMFSVREVPWHGLGKILDNPPNSEEAIHEAGLDWTVESRGVFWQNPMNDDKFIEVPNRKMLVRDSDNTPLGLVSNDYVPMQNIEAFKFFDPLVTQGIATYETAGSLREGRKIWVLARVGADFEIGNGDVIRKYVLLCNGHDGSTGIIVQPTPIRVVCNNTLMCSLGQGMVYRMQHRGDLKSKLDAAKEVIGFTAERFTELEMNFAVMESTKITTMQRAEYVQALIPDANEEASDRVKNRIARERDTIMRLSEEGMGTDLKVLDRGNVWAIYNAAIEFADWYKGERSKDIGSYQLFGEGALFKQRAMRIALAMTNGVAPLQFVEPETGIDSETASQVII